MDSKKVRAAMTDERAKRLAKLRQAYESGALDEDTYRAAVAALKAQGSGSVNISEMSDSALSAADITGRDKMTAENSSNIVVAGDYARINIGGAPLPPEGLRPAYLNWLIDQCHAVPLAGVDRKSISEETRSDLDLAAVYTALMTQRAEAAEREAFERPDRELKRLSALAALNAEKTLALLGDPGSGKSTFVNFVALCLAGELLGRPDANLALLTFPLPDDEDEMRRLLGRKDEAPKPQPWAHGALIPIRVVLRDFAARGLLALGQPVSGDTLWKFIVGELPEALSDFAKLLRDELLKAGGLLLLDGLDEVPEADQRREQVKAAVKGFVAMFPKVRVLVTSRTYAYQKQAWKLDGFAEAVLAPFGRGQIRRFVERWYDYVGIARRLSPEDAQGRATQLKSAIERNPRLSELAARPLLLTLMASLHAWRGGTLPEQREELYADAVELLLDQWESQKMRRKPDGSFELLQPSLAEWLEVDQKAVRALLNRLAFEAHRDQPDLKGTADISQDKLVGELLKLNLNRDVRPARLVEYVSVRAGLLEPRGVGVYAFPHRTFQEYLAACHLTGQTFPDELADLLRAEPNRWREVTLLAGAKAVRGVDANAWTLAEALCFNDLPAGQPADADLWGALLAAQVLVENNSLGHIAERHQPKVERIRRWLTHIVVEGKLPPVDRAQAGEALAIVGDPRDLEELITIDAGPFWMGSKDKGPLLDESPQHQVTLPAYRIGKYPVTVGQWKKFLAASPKHQYDPDSLKGFDNQPAHDVSWHDACTYCDWLTAQWRKANKIGPNEKARLPSEAEWEKAARGDDKREWSWKGDFDPNNANTSETGIGRTSAVGLFPSGKSPHGCLDMIGNVWEWTLSKDKKYPYKPNDGREDLKGDAVRVLRGGSFIFSRGGARCACRYDFHPDYRYDDVGFRVVVSPGSRS
jgi:formylglycine-generating enzyme required for sulfatase activity